MEREDPKVTTRSFRFPNIGESFELNSDWFDPLELVQNEHEPEEWQHDGSVIATAQTRTFQFRVFPSAVTIEKAIRAITESMLAIPEGQWLRAVKARYPNPHGNKTVCVADASWINPANERYFPALDGRGDSWDEGLIAVEGLLDPHILWLAEEQ